ncbi:MAG: hypothetical protein RI891_1231, partial [Gemmatimonadota bacterium]
MLRGTVRGGITAALLMVGSVSSPAQVRSSTASLSRTLLTEMIAARTTVSGNTTPLVESLAARFRAAGVPAADVMVLGPGERNRNLVVQLRGRDRAAKPRLFLAHLDVVEVDSAAW